MVAQPCDPCRHKVTLGRRDSPHASLSAQRLTPFRGSMFGGYEETTYKCRT